jgi:hypothetical protein
MAREWLNLIWGNASGAFYETWRAKQISHLTHIPRGWLWWNLLPRHYFD